MNYNFKKFVLLVFFFCSTLLYSQPKEYTLNRSFLSPGKDSAGQKLEFQVTFHQGYQAWATYTAQKTEEYIKAFYTYLGMPLSIHTPFIVSGKTEVWFFPAVGSKKAVRIGGVHNPGRIEIEYGLAPSGNPALLFHELGHAWFGYVNNQDTYWLVEGLVSFLPLILKEEGELLTFTDQELMRFKEHWGLYNGWDTKIDYPLLTDRRYEGPESLRTLFYVKSFHIQYLIYLELGRELYKQFLQHLVKDVTVYRKTSEVINLLEKLKKRDWSKVLTGWVLPGDYSLYKPADFSDFDTDGLLTIEELIIGTSPTLADTDHDTLPDGWEHTKSLNPLVADPTETAKALVQTDGLWADGLFTDWTHTGYWELTEQAEAKPPTHDLIKLRLTIRRKCLFVAVVTSTPAPRTGSFLNNLIFDLLIDLNDDREPDREIAFYLNKPDAPWVYYTHTKESSRLPELDTGLGEDGIELAVPLALPGQKQFAVLPIIRDTAGGFNYDEWQTWVKVDNGILETVAQHGLKTNLLDDDADKDGIPDVAEIYHNLDPFQVQDTVEIQKYGPFVDGQGGEWKVLPAVWVEDEDQQELVSPYDILGFYYLIRNKTLYCFAPFIPKHATWSGKMSNLMFDVVVDIDKDDQADREFAFSLAAPQIPWLYTKATNKSIMPAGLVSALKEGVATEASSVVGAEMAIPLDLIGSRNFRLYPIIWDKEKKQACEDFPAWIDVQY
jgi:hypothetical protein